MQTDRELMMELADHMKRAVEICRTLAFRREDTRWVRFGASFERLLAAFKTISTAGMRVV